MIRRINFGGYFKSLRHLKNDLRFLVFLLTVILAGCSKEINPGSQWLGKEATITKTGISYIYLKHGTGPKVEPGMTVETMVILKVGDSTEVWNTRKTNEPFVFRFRRDNMVDGFDEMIVAEIPNASAPINLLVVTARSLRKHGNILNSGGDRIRKYRHGCRWSHG